MAVARVTERFRNGGHNVSEDVVGRRYEGGIRNFFQLYRSLADGWSFYDNAMVSGPRLVAKGTRNMDTEVHDSEIWTRLRGGEFIMQETIKKDIDKLFNDRKGMDRALSRAVRQALLQHKRAGNPVATCVMEKWCGLHPKR